MLQSVSVIVPVYNGGASFQKCLEALEDCHPSPSEIIIVADGESDGSYRAAARNGHTTLVLAENSGPAAARNFGADSASGDILLFIDADVLVKKTIIEQVQQVFLSNRSISAVIGSYDDTPGDLGFISQYRNLLHHFTHQHSNQEASTFWGACGAIRREAFWSVNGFNPTYRKASIEDIDLGYRLRDTGNSILLAKDIQVTHLKRWELHSMIKTDIFRRAIPWSRLMLQRRTITNDLNVSWSARMSTLCVFLLCACALLPLANVAPLSVILLILPVVATLIFLNIKFYQFLIKVRGFFFMIFAFPLHWLYFLYSGLSFSLVFLGHLYCRATNRVMDIPESGR